MGAGHPARAAWRAIPIVGTLAYTPGGYQPELQTFCTTG
jgi:hypothetical protein